MISDPTRLQLGALKIDQQRPLLICDVDDVVVDFITCFGTFLHEQEMLLRPTPKSFHGEIVTFDRETYIGEQAAMSLVDEFFATRTHSMTPVAGSVASILEIAKVAEVVFLTNLPHSAGDQRRQNLAGLGLPFPCVTNSGPKGPAIVQLAQMSKGPVVFVDDSPFFISSAFEHAPDVHLVHFLHHEGFAAHAPQLDFVSLRAHSWDDVLPHVLDLVKG
jgi:hypothetical protein